MRRAAPLRNSRVIITTINWSHLSLALGVVFDTPILIPCPREIQARSLLFTYKPFIFLFSGFIFHILYRVDHRNRAFIGSRDEKCGLSCITVHARREIRLSGDALERRQQQVSRAHEFRRRIKHGSSRGAKGGGRRRMRDYLRII